MGGIENYTSSIYSLSLRLIRTETAEYDYSNTRGSTKSDNERTRKFQNYLHRCTRPRKEEIKYPILTSRANVIG